MLALGELDDRTELRARCRLHQGVIKPSREGLARASGQPVSAAKYGAPGPIGDQRYIDGRTRSFTNADLAVGHARVVILLPVPPNPFHETRLAKELVVLTAATPTLSARPVDLRR